MTAEEFAEALRRLVSEAEDAGLDGWVSWSRLRAWPRRCGCAWRSEGGSIAYNPSVPLH